MCWWGLGWYRTRARWSLFRLRRPGLLRPGLPRRDLAQTTTMTFVLCVCDGTRVLEERLAQLMQIAVDDDVGCLLTS